MEEDGEEVSSPDEDALDEPEADGGEEGGHHHGEHGEPGHGHRGSRRTVGSCMLGKWGSGALWFFGH